jgi:hypothetical protein
LKWAFGAKQERLRSMPGDDLVADPRLQVTQAITVRFSARAYDAMIVIASDWQS